jgi:L-alanine-DL-glutamate epimerase-like enolase superfamily enzyme
MSVRTRPEVAVERLFVSAYTVPTDEVESDGTLEWESTTVVVVEAVAGDETGIGYTYADVAAARLVEGKLAAVVEGANALEVGRAWCRMAEELRNVGRPGLGFMALSAVDCALWDLKARLLGVALVDALDATRESVPLYGSGGFCSYDDERLAEQLGDWVNDGIMRVKMKVGRDPEQDPRRVEVAREAIGADAELFVDANGAYQRKEALAWAERYAFEWGVTWFEEPVSSADIEGLRLLRDRAPAGLDIAAGEYAFVPADFRNLLAAGSVDCLQADVTRCGGMTGLLRAGALADAHGIALSGHCAPQLSAHALCAVPRLRHLEYFHDHVRVERLLFDGLLEPEGGALRPDRERLGHGLELRRADADHFLVAGAGR